MSGLGYTLPAVVALIAVMGLELAILRTGLFTKAEYWISMGIVVAFQVIIDGWLTKLSAPIVIYNEQHTSGVRFPWDIPVEDFVFGWAMVTAVLLLWVKQRPRRDDEGDRS
ncbi:lycopene cyclase domain-containing protein [Mycobacterium sp. EPa45]|uniref:lycopene cyclase domain-containing protein n=1 Tax=Mycobacterium sp. EPa45 TaxID=1545728 RepID=UPI0006424EB2|nr:lycopene cyclase domain-containing protein [Mycobacterium sp. EPa45]AKK28482.1 lycopene cyclase [Mycobacterium sp. EPa45]